MPSRFQNDLKMGEWVPNGTLNPKVPSNSLRCVTRVELLLALLGSVNHHAREMFLGGDF